MEKQETFRVRNGLFFKRFVYPNLRKRYEEYKRRLEIKTKSIEAKQNLLRWVIENDKRNKIQVLG